jgi:F0F1-type ATP synthase beta subunit
VVKTGLFGGAGVGKTVVILENSIHNIAYITWLFCLFWSG